MPLELQLQKEGGDCGGGGHRMVSCGAPGLDINSVTHAPGSFFQELQIPVTADQGHPLGGILTDPKCLLLHLGSSEPTSE